jgi:hypothetical protein
MSTVAVDLPHTATRGRSAPGAIDLTVGAIVLSVVLAIVQVPPIPFSPPLYLAPLAVLLADGPMRTAWTRVGSSRPLRWLTALLMLKIVMQLATQPFEYSLFAGIARIVAGWLTLVIAALYGASSVARFKRLGAMLVLATGLSAIWYLLELGVGAPFTVWRQALYADIYGAFDVDLVETIRSGLTPFRHQLGYQIVALLPLAAGFFLQTRRRSWQVAMLLTLVFGLLSLTASLQRSSLAAVGMAGLLFLLTGPRARTLLLLGGAAIGGAVVAGAILITQRAELAAVAENNLFKKLQSEEQQLDSRFRLQLQGRALELLVEYPLGLVASGVDWNEVGFRETYRKLHAAPSFYEAPFAVHNGYLSESVSLGLPFLVLIVILLGSIAVAIWRVVRGWSTAPPEVATLALSVACACAGMYSFQTLTHNASLATLEPSSLFLLALLVAAQQWAATIRASAAPAERVRSDG